MKKLIIRFFIFLLFLSIGIKAQAEVINITVQDTFIDQANPTTNFSASPTANLGGWEQDDSYLILPQYPADLKASEIIQARIWIYQSGQGGPHSLSLKRLDKAWIPTETNYLNARNGVLWASAGANNDSIAEGEKIFPSVNGGKLDVDITDMVKAQIDGQNFGFILTGANDGHSYANLYTADAEEGKRTVIVIETGTIGEYREWFIRPDGGTTGLNQQCSGDRDKPYPGTGINQPCAAKDPEQAAKVAKGGNKVIIYPGSYQTDMVSFGPGSALQKTDIAAKGWTDCNWNHCNPDLGVEFYGTSGSWGNILGVAKNTIIRGIKFTDHSSCIGRAWDKCDGQEFVGNGITWLSGADGVELYDVTAYGMNRGLEIKDMAGITIKARNLVLVGNTHANIEMSAIGDKHGKIIIDGGSMKWSGCGMKYPLVNPDNLADSRNIHHCTSQDQGGYGDNFAVNAHGSFIDIELYNLDIGPCVSDCIDTIYRSGGTLKTRNLRIENAAGASVKIAGVWESENDTILGSYGVMWDNKPWVTTAAEAGYAFNSVRGNSVIGIESPQGTKIKNLTMVCNRDICFDVNSCEEGKGTIDIDHALIIGGHETGTQEVSDFFYSYHPYDEAAHIDGTCYKYLRVNNTVFSMTKDGPGDAANGTGNKYFANPADLKFKTPLQVSYPKFYDNIDVPMPLELAADSPAIGYGAQTPVPNPTPTPTPTPTPVPCPTCPPPITCPPQTTCPPPVICPNPPVCTIPTSKRITPSQFKAAKGFKDCTARAQMNDPCEIFDAGTKEIFIYKKLVE